MTLEELGRRLRAGLASPLPGGEAQARMAPRPGRPGWKAGHVPEGARPGAGLLLLYPWKDAPHLLLTVRTQHLPSHRGQVSLPGGALEAGETVEHAALREASEEVGLDPRAVEVLGVLSPLHIPASGYVLHAVVSCAAERPALRPAEREVERILEVPFAHLLEPENLRHEPRILQGQERLVPYFALEGEKVWGATAMVLAELLWLLGAPPDPWSSVT